MVTLAVGKEWGGISDRAATCSGLIWYTTSLLHSLPVGPEKGNHSSLSILTQNGLLAVLFVLSVVWSSTPPHSSCAASITIILCFLLIHMDPAPFNTPCLYLCSLSQHSSLHTPRLEAVWPSKTLVPYHLTMWHHNPEDHASWNFRSSVSTFINGNNAYSKASSLLTANP
jgi:hypothetical protein